MATAHLGGDPSKLCDQPPHHFVPIVLNQPAGGNDYGPKKLFSFKNINGEGQYFRGTEKDLDNYLDRNQLTLFDSAIDPSCSSNFAFFRDIESLSTSGDESQLLNPRYFTQQQSDVKTMLDNANKKIEALNKERVQNVMDRARELYEEELELEAQKEIERQAKEREHHERLRQK